MVVGLDTVSSVLCALPPQNSPLPLWIRIWNGLTAHCFLYRQRCWKAVSPIGVNVTVPWSVCFVCHVRALCSNDRRWQDFFCMW